MEIWNEWTQAQGIYRSLGVLIVWSSCVIHL